MPDAEFKPTHEFHLITGSIVIVRAELRGDWVAFEADGTFWSTVSGDTAVHWTCSKRIGSRLLRVVKYGHRFTIESRGKSFRFVCECSVKGSWVRTDDRAADNGDRHHLGAMVSGRAAAVAQSEK